MIVLSCLEGIYHGLIFLRRGWDSFKFNIHNFFSFNKVMIATTITVAFILGRFYSIYDLAFTIILAGISHTFFHSGVYYKFIGRKWNSEKLIIDKNSAKINLSYKTRLILFIISIVLWMMYYFILKDLIKMLPS